MSARVVLIACALVLGPTGARGQTAAKARALTREALSHYKAGQYDKAIARFAQAYTLTKAPLLLYDIAQAYRLGGDCVQALRYYGDYLRQQPAAPNRASVEAKRAAMQSCAQAKTTPPPPATVDEHAAEAKPAAANSSAAAALAPPAPDVAPLATTATAAASVGPAPTLTATRRPRAHPALIAGIAAGAAGLTLVATAVYFSVQAADASNQVGHLFEVGGTWDDHLRAVESTGRSASVTAAALYSLGGALVLGGAIALAIDRRQHRMTTTWVRDR
jgi:tetratricopeptide (TPR) repeat protein